jgi:histidyl-tRNA synthetase
MTHEKGLDDDIADKIGEYVKHKGIYWFPCINVDTTTAHIQHVRISGGPDLLDKLTADATLTANESAKQGLADMNLLFTLLGAYDVLNRVSKFIS